MAASLRGLRLDRVQSILARVPERWVHCRIEARLSGKDSAVWKSPTATTTLGPAVVLRRDAAADTTGSFGDFHRRNAPGRIYPTASGKRSSDLGAAYRYAK
jgi:hypothetical protein